MEAEGVCFFKKVQILYWLITKEILSLHVQKKRNII